MCSRTPEAILLTLCSFAQLKLRSQSESFARALVITIQLIFLNLSIVCTQWRYVGRASRVWCILETRCYSQAHFTQRREQTHRSLLLSSQSRLMCHPLRVRDDHMAEPAGTLSCRPMRRSKWHRMT
jgi:hypothetical protein